MSQTKQTEQIDALTNRLHNLEINQTFHEDSIEALEKTVAQQHQEIQHLQNQIRLLSDYLKTMRQDAIRHPSDETPPPHY